MSIRSIFGREECVCEYVCEKHGKVDIRLNVEIPSRDIHIDFCTLCWVEKLEELGVKKLKILDKQ